MRTRGTHLIAAAAFAVLATFGVTVPISAQTGSINGQVTAAGSERPLAGAQVFIPGTGVGNITNNEGRFLLLNVPTGPQTVRVQMLGYEQAEQQVDVQQGATATANFRLGQSAIDLDAVVVTGQGRARQRRELSTTIDVINQQTIDMAPVTSVDELLRGRISGATISATSAQPGTAGLINFRGVSSVLSNQTPVIYVDGVRVDNAISTSSGTGGEQSSALSELLTSDIERIEVTKGGAASTLYGSNAAAGVIQIFTRKGSPGEPRVTVRVEQGFDTPELKYILDVGEIFPDLVEDGANPDFLRDNFFQTGHFQNYHVGVSGGESGFTYNVAGRMQQSDGTQVKNANELFNLRGGIQAQVSDRLRLDFSGTFTRSRFDRLFNGSAIADPLTTFEVGDAFFFSGVPRDADLIDDVLDLFISPDINEEVNRFIFSSGANYQIGDNFAVRGTVGIDHRNNEQRIIQPIGFTPGEITGEVERFNRVFTSATVDVAGTISYPQTENFSSDFTFGIQGFRDDESIINASGTTFALPGAPDIDEAADITAFEINQEVFNGGIFFEEQIGLWNNLFLNGGVRLDFNSTFGEDVDFEAYPKAGVSYLISDEEFWDPVRSVLSDVKLRGAFGKTGNFPPPFTKDRTFNAISFRGESAPRFNNPGNLDLSPEVTSTFEAGADLALFDNRIGLNFTWYRAVTDDALFFVPEPPATGLGTQIRNVGEITNTGIELDWFAQILNARDLGWAIRGTFQTVDNEITDMGTSEPFFLSGSGQKRVCGPPNDCGLGDGEGREVGAWFVNTPVDTNNDGLLDSSELQWHEGPSPEMSGSFATDVTLFNRLTLTALADWATGFQAFDWGSIWATFNGIFRRELVEEDFTFPVRHDLDGNEIGPFSQSAARSAFLVDGDYLKLREISARYALPSSISQSFGVDRAVIYVSGRNLAIWTENPMIDPELNGLANTSIFSTATLNIGSESSITLSPPKQFRFGIEATF